MGKRIKKNRKDNDNIRKTICANRSRTQEHHLHRVLHVLARCRRGERPVPGGTSQSLEGFDSFEHRSDIRTWIYRVALNTCISIDRKKKRRSSEVRLTMDINLFEDRDEDTRQVDMLHKRISKLQPFDRAIVLLWLENLSYDEIGQIVGISAKNVSVRLFRIREQLKNMSND